MFNFQNHLHFTHHVWSQFLTKDCLAIDATCGNGHDSYFLAPYVKHLYCFDIQEKALETCKEKLYKFNNSSFFLKCHSNFSEEIQPQTVTLIVYNLGYLPGSDKKITTMVETTLKSIQNALNLLKDNGLICITLYPGHAEGKKEEESIVEFAKTLNKKEFQVTHHQWINRQLAPHVLLIHKALHYPKAHLPPKYCEPLA